MRKKDLCKLVAEKTEIRQKDVQKVVDAVLDVMQETLVSGESIILPGFGTFEVRRRNGRNGVNPRTGERIEIAPTRNPAFKPGAVLKKAVAND